MAPPITILSLAGLRILAGIRYRTMSAASSAPIMSLLCSITLPSQSRCSAAEPRSSRSKQARTLTASPSAARECCADRYEPSSRGHCRRACTSGRPKLIDGELQDWRSEVKPAFCIAADARAVSRICPVASPGISVRFSGSSGMTTAWNFATSWQKVNRAAFFLYSAGKQRAG
jgi:hypothetical protein